MERGYFKIWRKIEDSQSYNRSALHRAILLTVFVKASWKGGYFCGKEVLPGQMATSISGLAEELRTPRSSVLRALREIEKDGVIKLENMGNRWTMITLVKWDCYQQTQEKVGQPVDNHRSTTGQPVDTLKEGKNLINTPIGVLSESELPDPPPPVEITEDKNPVFDLEAEEPQNNGVPACPQKDILRVYHEILPELPKSQIWRTNSATALKTRWREKWKEGRFIDRGSGIDYFRRFFSYIRKSDWLMGRKAGWDGRPFVCDLEWIVQAKHFDDIIKGKYHDNRGMAA